MVRDLSRWYTNMDYTVSLGFIHYETRYPFFERHELRLFDQECELPLRCIEQVHEVSIWITKSMEIRKVMELWKKLCFLHSQVCSIVCLRFFIERNVSTTSSVLSNIMPVKQKSMDTIEIIRRIGRLHDRLCTIMDDVNFIYSFQVICPTFEVKKLKSNDYINKSISVPFR